MIINEEVDRQLLDTLIRCAAKESVQRELEEAARERTPSFSPAFERRMERLVRRQRHALPERLRHKLPPVVMRVAVSLLLLFCCLSAAMLCVPTVRAAVAQVVIGWFDQYVNFKYSDTGGDTYAFLRYAPRYIPEGFVLTKLDVNGAGSMYSYENETGQILSIDIASVGGITSISVDNERTEYSSVFVGDCPAHQLWDEANNMCVLIWYTPEAVFNITYDGTPEETLYIAEHIQKSE